jgi:hypothetical protein
MRDQQKDHVVIREALGMRRFLAWIMEKLLELQLFIVVLLLVKFFWPLTPGAYVDGTSFANGVAQTWAGTVDDADFMTRAYLDDSYFLYGWRTCGAAAYVVAHDFYFASFYLVTSGVAWLLSGNGGHVRNALLAYCVSAGYLAWRQLAAYDIPHVWMAGALFGGGLIAVILSLWFGHAMKRWLAGGVAPDLAPSGGGRIGFDLGE